MSHKKSKCVVEPSLKENHKCTESYLLLWCWKEMQKREFNNGIDIGTRIQPTSCWKTQGKMIKKNKNFFLNIKFAKVFLKSFKKFENDIWGSFKKILFHWSDVLTQKTELNDVKDTFEQIQRDFNSR